MAAVMLLLSGCTVISEEEEAVPADASVSEPQAYPVTVDGLKFNSSPMTVGSLSPAVTEIIYELGFGDRLVCRSTYCDYPEEVSSLEAAGSGANPDFDRIIELHPSLLITQSPMANKDILKLSDAGITVMFLPVPDSIEGLYDMYRSLALIFEGSINGEGLAEEKLKELKAAFDSAKGSCDSLIYIMNITDDGFSAATGESFAGDFASCFGKNAAASFSGFAMTAEELCEADPQVIFLAHPLKSSDFDEETAQQLSAFENGFVYVIDGSLIERPTSRLAGITLSIAEKIREDTGGAELSGGFAVIPEDMGGNETEVSTESDDTDETDNSEE